MNRVKGDGGPASSCLRKIRVRYEEEEREEKNDNEERANNRGLSWNPISIYKSRISSL